MGRDFFTIDSNITIRQSNMEAMLLLLDFEPDEYKNAQENLADALADLGWQVRSVAEDSTSFYMADDGDQDFDWEFFELLTYLLEEGSFYECEGDGNTIEAIYVLDERYEWRTYQIDPENPGERRLLSKQRYKSKAPKILAEAAKTKKAANPSHAGAGFPNIDLSFWQTKNKEWMDERKSDWEKIESEFFKGGGHKSKKGLAIVKRYFLKGSMPDWQKLKDWEDYQRHLDLFYFVWLHPSNDLAVLQSLCNEYVASHFVTDQDIATGINGFLMGGIIGAFRPLIPGTPRYVQTGNSEFYFDVLLGNLKQRPRAYQLRLEKACRSQDIFDIAIMTEWLANDRLDEQAGDFLYQYDRPLEWWYEHCDRSEKFFEKKTNQDMLWNLYLAFYRIVDFPNRENRDPRQDELANKLTRLLDEGDFMPTVKSIWEKTRDGRIVIEAPWEEYPHGDFTITEDGKPLTLVDF